MASPFVQQLFQEHIERETSAQEPLICLFSFGTMLSLCVGSIQLPDAHR